MRLRNTNACWESMKWSWWICNRTKPSMALVREVPDGPCIWSWVWRYVVPGHARVLWPSTSRKLMFNTVFSFFVHDSLLGAARAWSLKFFRQLAQHVAPQVCSLLSPWFWALVFFFVGWSSVFWLPLSIWRACKQIQQRILRFHFQRFFSCEALIKVVAAKVFVETHKSDLGGHFWRVQMQHTQLGLVIYIVVSNLLPSLPCWTIVGLEFGVSFFSPSSSSFNESSEVMTLILIDREESRLLWPQKCRSLSIDFKTTLVKSSRKVLQ